MSAATHYFHSQKAGESKHLKQQVQAAVVVGLYLYLY